MKTNLPGVPAMRTLYRFLKDESGATAIEYGLIAALVSVVIIAGLTLARAAAERHVHRHQRLPRRPSRLLAAVAIRASPPIG